MRGPLTSFDTFAADQEIQMLQPTDWLPFVLPNKRVRMFRSTTEFDTAVNSMAISAPVYEDDQTMLLFVHTVRTDTTTPTTPTVINGASTWVEVATLAYDSTGANRGKISLFRTQLPTAGVVDTVDIDWGGVNQSYARALMFALAGEDRSGTNGSAAIVQNATGTAGAVADVSASLAAFGSADNATAAFVGLLDDAGTANGAIDGTDWSDMWYSFGDNGSSAWYFTGAVHRFDNDTTPVFNVSQSTTSGMIAVELKADPLGLPDAGKLASPYVIADTGGTGEYTFEIQKLEFRFQT